MVTLMETHAKKLKAAVFEVGSDVSRRSLGRHATRADTIRWAATTAQRLLENSPKAELSESDFDALCFHRSMLPFANPTEVEPVAIEIGEEVIEMLLATGPSHANWANTVDTLLENA